MTKPANNSVSFAEIVDVNVLHLDAIGYGYGGTFTRRDWQRECHKYLLAGRLAFKEWQESWISEEKVNNTKANFGCVVSYSNNTKSTYDNYLIFPRCTLDFVGSTFNHLEVFNFDFLLDVCFAGSLFNGTAGFADAIFYESVNFDGAYFLNSAWFSNAVFHGDAWFLDANFVENAFYDGVIFNKDAWFGNACFQNLVTFEKANFFKRVGFSKTHFNGASSFFISKFCDVVTFENAIFENVGHFEEAKFETNTPSFRGCKIDSTRLEFSDDSYFPKSETGEYTVKNISFLKRLADEHGQTDQALNFNAMELRAKALLPNAGFWFRLFTSAYERVSDFGRSFTKPLKWYGGMLLIIFLLALGNAGVNSPIDCKNENLRILSDLWRDDTPCNTSKDKPDDKTRLNGYRAAAEYTIYRAAGILDFSDNGKATDAVSRRLFGQSFEPGWMRFVGLVKAIASTALLFLAALGLRNKYRIK